MSNNAADWYAEQDLRERVAAAATESGQSDAYWRKVTAEGLSAQAEIKLSDRGYGQRVHEAQERLRRAEFTTTGSITGPAAEIYEAIGKQAEAYMREIESTRREEALAQKRAPIIAVDFDGTLCESAWPGIGEAKWGTIQALIAAQAAGARLILWTNRVGARLREAVEWCRNRELEFDAVNENLPEVLERFTTNPRKVYADIYLDDKAAQPSGNVIAALWETARAVMNEAAAAGQPQACNPAHRGAVTAEQFEAIWNDDSGEEAEQP